MDEAFAHREAQMWKQATIIIALFISSLSMQGHSPIINKAYMYTWMHSGVKIFLS